MAMEYPTTYMLMKASVCHFLACKHEGNCNECEFGEIRKQAAKDHDVIFGHAKRKDVPYDMP